jgi:hypothetical protein
MDEYQGRLLRFAPNAHVNSATVDMDLVMVRSLIERQRTTMGRLRFGANGETAFLTSVITVSRRSWRSAHSVRQLVRMRAAGSSHHRRALNDIGDGVAGRAGDALHRDSA